MHLRGWQNVDTARNLFLERYHFWTAGGELPQLVCAGHGAVSAHQSKTRNKQHMVGPGRHVLIGCAPCHHGAGEELSSGASATRDTATCDGSHEDQLGASCDDRQEHTARKRRWEMCCTDTGG